MALLRHGSSLKDKITYNNGMLAYPSGMIATKPLLVDSRSHHGGVPHLLEHVDVYLALFLGLLLIISVDTQCVEVKVGGDDRLSPIDEEQGGVPRRVVHAHPQALEQGREFVHPLSSMNLEIAIDTGFDPL